MFCSIKATPSWPRLVTRRLSSRLFVLIGASALLACSAHSADLPPLSFDEALRLASEQSLQLSAQRSAIVAADQATVSARELPDPKLFFGVDNLPVTTSDAFSLTQDFMTMRKIGVMQEFPRGEKRELKGKLAERVAAREQAMLVDAQAAIRRDVATAWVERYFTERMATVVEEQVNEVQLQSDALRAGLKAGKTPPAEYLAVQVNLQTLLDKRAEFDKQSARAKAMLMRWLGNAAARPLAPFTAPTMPAEHGTLPEHIANHPHVQSLDRQVEVAQTDAALAQAQVKPDWSLQFAYQQRGPSFSNMVSVQVSIDLPILQARRQNRDLAAKLALTQQARDLKEDAVRVHISEALAAQSDWDAATNRLKRFDESLLPLSRERTVAALAAYRGGRADLSSVLVARRDELDLKLQALQLTADQARAYARLLYFMPSGEQP